MSLQGKRILFLAGPLYEDLELWYPKIRLEEEGATTIVAGIGEKTYQGSEDIPSLSTPRWIKSIPGILMDSSSREASLLISSGASKMSYS